MRKFPLYHFIKIGQNLKILTVNIRWKPERDRDVSYIHTEAIKQVVKE